MRPDRYRRQKLLPWLDEAGQTRLRDSSILIARVGGLGGPLTQSLVAAGVGRIVFYHEGDLLEEDLHRMILMDTGHVGEPRAPQAVDALRRRGAPDVRVEGFDARVTPDDALAWMRECDLAIGAAPTYEERLTLNDAAVATGKPFLDAAMYADEAHILAVRPGQTACLRCLLPQPPAWRADFPVLGAVSAMIGTWAASMAVRALAGGTLPWGEFLHIDAETVELTRTIVPKRADCPTCATTSGSARAASASA